MARMRRKTASQPIEPQGVERMASLSSSPYSFVSASDKKTQQTLASYSVELKTITSDLSKTIMLALIAFGVEIFLYWLLQH